MITSHRESLALVRWQPSRGTAAALATEAGMIIAYSIIGKNSNNMGVAALVGLLIVPILAVAIPVWWTTMVERQGLGSLGITAHHWLPSIILGLGLSLLTIVPLLSATRVTPAPERWLPMAAAGAVSLFEPLFIFGWLQLRFEKDFGALPAILLAALGFSLYHIGYLPQAMSSQFYSAVLFAVAFRLTANLLVTWPLLWAVYSAGACIGSNICFYNWGMVSGSAMVFVFEVVLIVALALLQHRRVLKIQPAH